MKLYTQTAARDRMIRRMLRMDAEEDETETEQADSFHGNTRLPFGLCKEEGIELPNDATPKQAWEALEKKSGITPSAVFKQLREIGKVDVHKLSAKVKEKPYKLPHHKVGATAKRYGCRHKSDSISQKKRNNALWFKSKQDSFAYFKKTYAKSTYSKMPASQKRKIYNYSSKSWYVNAPLFGFQYRDREGKDPQIVDYWKKYVGCDNVVWDKEHAEACEELTKACGDNELKEDVWFEHGCANASQLALMLGLDYNTKAGDISDELLQSVMENDEELYYPAFMSCGINKSAGHGFQRGGIVFNIYAPKGTKGIYATPCSKFGGYDPPEDYTGEDSQRITMGESEFIMQRGTVLKIRKFERDEKGVLYLDLDVVAQEPSEIKVG